MMPGAERIEALADAPSACHASDARPRDGRGSPYLASLRLDGISAHSLLLSDERPGGLRSSEAFPRGSSKEGRYVVLRHRRRS